MSRTAPPWATPRMTAFVFAHKKQCNRPRIAVVWSAKSDQGGGSPSCARLAPRDSSWRSPCRNPLLQEAAHGPEPGCCSAVPLAVTNTEVADLILVTHEVPDRRPALRQDEVAMLFVSATATWSRMAVIHAGCDLYFWAFAAHVSFSTTSIAFVTPRPLWFHLRVACLLQFDRMPGVGDAFAPGDTRVGRQRFSASSGTGGKKSITPRSVGMRGINGVVAPSTTLSPSVAAGSPHGPWPAPSATLPGATC